MTYIVVLCTHVLVPHFPKPNSDRSHSRSPRQVPPPMGVAYRNPAPRIPTCAGPEVNTAPPRPAPSSFQKRLSASPRAPAEGRDLAAGPRRLWRSRNCGGRRRAQRAARGRGGAAGRGRCPGLFLPGRLILSGSPGAAPAAAPRPGSGGAAYKAPPAGSRGCSSTAP